MDTLPAIGSCQLDRGAVGVYLEMELSAKLKKKATRRIGVTDGGIFSSVPRMHGKRKDPCTLLKRYSQDDGPEDLMYMIFDSR